MTRDEAQAVLAAALRPIAPDVDLELLDADAPFQQEADIDSMDFLNLLIGVHERTGVEIPESDYSKLGSLNEILTYLTGTRPVRASRARYQAPMLPAEV